MELLRRVRVTGRTELGFAAIAAEGAGGGPRPGEAGICSGASDNSSPRMVGKVGKPLYGEEGVLRFDNRFGVEGAIRLRRPSSSGSSDPSFRDVPARPLNPSGEVAFALPFAWPSIFNVFAIPFPKPSATSSPYFS